nr:transposase [Parendozoicomonas sp. Alg238-R29]
MPSLISFSPKTLPTTDIIRLYDKAKKVMKYLRSEDRLLDIHIPPPYSPELNPVELVWSVLKSGRIGRMALKTKDSFSMLSVQG